MSGGPGASVPAVRLSVRGVTVHRGGRPVLDRVDVDVRAGELVVLVGPNGAGKSTLLSVLSGDLVPDAGEVLLDGAPLARRRAGELARLRSVLMQSNDVSFPFTVDEVVRMGRAPWTGREESDRDEAEAAAAIAVAELEPMTGRRLPELSGGERARAAAARVRAQAAGVTLLDEPTAALDVRHQERLLGDLRTRVDDGVAAVVVLHDLDMAAAWADRVVVLADGAVRADGPPAAALRSDLLGEVYRHPISVVADPGDPARVMVRPERRPAHADRKEPQLS